MGAFDSDSDFNYDWGCGHRGHVAAIHCHGHAPLMPLDGGAGPVEAEAAAAAAAASGGGDDDGEFLSLFFASLVIVLVREYHKKKQIQEGQYSTCSARTRESGETRSNRALNNTKVAFRWCVYLRWCLPFF